MQATDTGVKSGSWDRELRIEDGETEPFAGTSNAQDQTHTSLFQCGLAQMLVVPPSTQLPWHTTTNPKIYNNNLDARCWGDNTKSAANTRFARQMLSTIIADESRGPPNRLNSLVDYLPCTAASAPAVSGTGPEGATISRVSGRRDLMLHGMSCPGLTALVLEMEALEAWLVGFVGCKASLCQYI